MKPKSTEIIPLETFMNLNLSEIQFAIPKVKHGGLKQSVFFT